MHSVRAVGDNGVPTKRAIHLTCQHRAERDELRIRFSGVVTHHDIVDCCVEMAADPGCQDLDYAVIDFSAMSGCSCSGPDIELIARASRRLVGSGKSGAPVFLIEPDPGYRSQLLRLEGDGRVEVCGTDAQARARIEALRTAR